MQNQSYDSSKVHRAERLNFRHVFGNSMLLSDATCFWMFLVQAARAHSELPRPRRLRGRTGERALRGRELPKADGNYGNANRKHQIQYQRLRFVFSEGQAEKVGWGKGTAQSVKVRCEFPQMSQLTRT